jgi:hypothetical protein
MFSAKDYGKPPSAEEVAVLNRVKDAYDEDFKKFSLVCEYQFGIDRMAMYPFLAIFMCWLFYTGKIIIKEKIK